MAKTTIKLEYILKIANNVEFDNTDVYISRLLYEYYNEIPNYTLDKMLDILNVSKQRFKRYINQIGCKNYTELKDEIIFDQIVRMTQIKERYYHFRKDNLLSAIEKMRKKYQYQK